MKVHRQIVLGLITGLAGALSARAEVHIFIQDSNGVAQVQYECTAGEMVRAFALNVSVDQGQIVGVSGFFRGVSTAAATGYGIFPASYRDHLRSGGTNINWSFSDYTPLAVVADAPEDTLPGLNSGGVTLELGGLWDPNQPESIPASAGILCELQLSQPAKVSVSPNASRGGVVGAYPSTFLQPTFTGALVGPAVTSVSFQNGLTTILFQDGELQSAPSVEGPWTDTGDTSGTHVEYSDTTGTKFFRVRAL